MTSSAYKPVVFGANMEQGVCAGRKFDIVGKIGAPGWKVIDTTNGGRQLVWGNAPTLGEARAAVEAHVEQLTQLELQAAQSLAERSWG